MNVVGSISVVAICLLTSLGPCIAEETEYTISQAITDALLHDPRISAARMGRQSAEEGRLQANSFRKPTISGVGQFSFADAKDVNTSGSLQRDGERYFGGVEVAQSLYSFGRNQARIGQSEGELSRSEHEFKTIQQDVIYETAAAFIAILEAKDIVRVFSEHQKVLEELVEATKAQVDLNLKTNVELLLVQSRLRQAEGEHASSNTQLDVAHHTLLRLTGVRPGPLSLLNILDYQQILPSSLDEAVTYALENSPRILQANDEVNIAEFTLDIDKSELRPEIVLRGQFNRGRVANIASGSSQVGISLNVPLYQGGLLRSQVRQSAYRLGQMRFLARQEQALVREQAQTAWLRYDDSIEARGLWQKALNAERTSLAGIEEQVNEQLQSILFLLEAREQMRQVEIRSSKADFAVHGRAYQLLRAIGAL